MQQYIECDKGLYPRENIEKHSKNIIDLIEVGDVVKVLDTEWIRVIKIDDEELLKDFIEEIKEKNWELLSIVTKQQFESMEYKI